MINFCKMKFELFCFELDTLILGVKGLSVCTCSEEIFFVAMFLLHIIFRTCAYLLKCALASWPIRQLVWIQVKFTWDYGIFAISSVESQTSPELCGEATCLRGLVRMPIRKFLFCCWGFYLPPDQQSRKQKLQFGGSLNSKYFDKYGVYLKRKFVQHVIFMSIERLLLQYNRAKLKLKFNSGKDAKCVNANVSWNEINAKRIIKIKYQLY